MSEIKSLYLYIDEKLVLTGRSFGHFPETPYVSELVFNTSMQGYQEVITDPSYCDQSIVMTYPLIGNYGLNKDDSESVIPYLKTLIVREQCDHPSNFRSKSSIDTFLKRKKIVGMHEVDTRKLTRIIRSQGAIKCLISPTELTDSELEPAFQEELPQDQIQRVSTKAITHFPIENGPRVILMDFGYKKNILSSLISRGCDVIVVPFDTSAETIIDLNPEGIVLSNGPGDPESIASVLPAIKSLQEKYPMLCICMGHEIFAMANGAKIRRMKFGHRGANHPVKDTELNRVFITAQNHGYCVDEHSIDGTDLEVTQYNLNDNTIEGLRHTKFNCVSVQYHPEASPGPNDTKYLFDNFIKNLEGGTNALK